MKREATGFIMYNNIRKMIFVGLFFFVEATDALQVEAMVIKMALCFTEPSKICMILLGFNNLQLANILK